MAINKNHEFEELDGVKCGIVEKNVNPERVAFLKDLLEFNGFTVIAVPTPPPKVAPPPPSVAAPIAIGVAKETTPKEGEEPVVVPPPPPTPETFTVGVTDYTFNVTNAIFGRLLKAKNGQVVTLAYWQQKDAVNNDEVPYYES
jgi:hypothetical protein